MTATREQMIEDAVRHCWRGLDLSKLSRQAIVLGWLLALREQRKFVKAVRRRFRYVASGEQDRKRASSVGAGFTG
jgi:hypothetical protein